MKEGREEKKLKNKEDSFRNKENIDKNRGIW